MILAFSPEQAYEVSQAFDASWFMNEALYMDHIRKGDAGKEQDKNAPTSTAEDQAKTSSENCKKPCRRNANRCRPNNIHKATFQPCRRYNQMARCNRHANNPETRTIEQKTPIHMHDETPDAARMSLDVTGFTPQNVTINVEDNVVSIKGQRTNKLGDVFVLDRKFRLDKNTVIMEGVTAAFDDGILELTVPKKSISGPRMIPIVVSNSTSNDSEKSTYHEEEDVNTDSADGMNTSQLTDGAIPGKEEEEESKELEHDSITVETVEADNANNEEYDDDKETRSSDSTKDEAWEEVSN